MKLSPEREYQLYGEPLNFKDRATNLERLAAAYFVQHPDQQFEHEFEALIVRARNLSIHRNEIAHSIADKIRLNPDEWALLPPLYTQRKHAPDHAPSYAYTADDIRGFSDLFLVLLRQAQAMHLTRFSPQVASLSKRP